VANKKRVKAKATNKLKWIKPELTRVALNPEQAVLSCCNILYRGQVNSTVTTLVQCWVMSACTGTGVGWGDLSTS